MCRGNYRKIVAAGMLTACLLLAVAPTAGARVLEPVTHDGVASQQDPLQELAFWERVRLALSSIWDQTSVLIDPFG